MTNNELFEKIDKILKKETEERRASGRLNRKYNKRNDGLWVMFVYRKGNRSLFRGDHLDIRNFIDNMDFGQMRRICVEAGGKFYVLEKQQKGIKPEEILKGRDKKIKK